MIVWFKVFCSNTKHIYFKIDIDMNRDAITGLKAFWYLLTYSTTNIGCNQNILESNRDA